VQGKSILDFIHPDYREMSISRVRQIMESGQTTEWTEQKLIRLNGKAFDAETKGTPFVYQGRQSILTIVRDVTERKKNQETLLRYERLATVGKVIAAIAHEIRNPLAMVAGMTKLLKTKLEVRKEYSQEIQTILSQTDRLGLFMNDILDYSREMEMNKTAVDARFLLEESLTAAQAQVGASHVGVDVEWKMEGVLPSFPGDKDRLQQVIINLILNAYQALGEKGVLTIFARAEKGWMRLGVKDDGPGINEVDLPRLFEPFFTTKKHGSGLGLPISQKIVEAHGGKIEVQRIQPHGTLFTLHLPLSKT
jgi:signal transduction histidine kinase